MCPYAVGDSSTVRGFHGLGRLNVYVYTSGIWFDIFDNSTTMSAKWTSLYNSGSECVQ